MFNSPHGVMFHHFHDSFHPAGQGSLNADSFEKMLNYLGVHNFLSAHDWLNKFRSGKLSDTDLCVTMDDNLQCQYDIALDVLEKYNITAFWFVYTGALEGNLPNLEIYRYFRSKYFSDVEDFYIEFFNSLTHSQFGELFKKETKDFIPSSYLSNLKFYSDNDRLFRYTRDQILGDEKYNVLMAEMLKKYHLNKSELSNILLMGEQELSSLHKKSHVIGLHSHNHPTQLRKLSFEDQKNEYTQNYNFITKITGSVPATVAHPCNSYDDNTLKILKNLGVEMGFRANLDQKKYSNLELPRIDHADIIRKML